MLQWNEIDITIAGLQQHYQRGDFTPRELVELILAHIDSETHLDNPVWIRRLTLPEISNYLTSIEAVTPNSLPLYGIPFAIKDNIDLANIPTTAACPEFAYTPDKSAFVVEQLIAAGAIPLGKTNMDQFATGLVGVRSPEPWGPCKNALNPEIISGGSSSGSSVAVAKGWVSFSLGTDTAGSGRVPASLNNIVGIKPSRGLLSNRGLVPACKSLDCISIFALTASDANQVLDVASAFDVEDAYSRKNPYANGTRYFNSSLNKLCIGVPARDQLAFFGNAEAEKLFTKSCELLEAMGHEMVAIDFSPFLNAAKLLYEGPWVTERYLATKTFIDESPEKLLPVIRDIITPGKFKSASDSFTAQYQLQQLAQQASAIFAQVDAIVTPTNGTYYAIGEVLADPIALNSNMGYYTNFMNLLDCAAIAVPTDFYQNGVGFGVTFFHRAFTDKRLASLAAQLQHHTNLTLGALKRKSLQVSSVKTEPKARANIVVCGAHLSGLPLNWQLVERGAHLVEVTQTAGCYNFYALTGGPPFRPGLLREGDGNGAAIEVEVWSIPLSEFGSFVSEIPAPLGIGKVQLADGRWEPGFICEPYGIAGAEDITSLGSWRTYIANRG